ncbi:MAG: Digeranylgeranylglyceryl phosphate synthase [Methanonatronarchaeales archaeon]|nr:Digeranylgeranylglyceryl phosphate synthase [Methanonatronarchaeales archaeon]
MGLRGAFEATRPGNAAMTLVAVVVGGIVVPSFSTADVASLLTASAIAALVTAGGNVVNDLFDAEIDEVNRPGRPIPGGRLSREGAIVASAVLLGSSVLGLLINPLVLAIAVFNAAILVLYSLRLKRLPLVGNAAVSYLVGSAFLFGGAAVGGPVESVPLFLLALLATLGREVAKDVEDLRGDAGRADTLATRYGPGRASEASAAVSLLAAAASPLPYLLGVLGHGFLPFAAAADLLLIGAASSLLRSPSVEAAGTSQRRIKAAMAVALAGFLVGAI